MSALSVGVSREKAMETLKTYNSEAFHIRHALTVSAVMGYFADALGHGEDKEFWSLVGLMHDVDFEKWPEEHCVKAEELLSEAGFGPEFIRAVICHGWGMTRQAHTEVKPEHEMEKVLFASDELTGLIGAAALMRPSKSTKDMELKSLKKKFKDKKFAAGCSRETIAQGAELLGWELDELLEKTLKAMQETEDAIEAAVAENT